MMNDKRWTMDDGPINFGWRMGTAHRSLNSGWEYAISFPNSELRTPNSKGMTFIEVLVVILIVGVLAAVVMPRFDFATSTRASVDGAAYIVASDIRYAQEFAMANRISKSVIFTSGSSVYTFSPTSTMDPSGRLPTGATVGSNFTITFNSLGEPTAGGGGSVTVSGGGQTKTISVVNYTGKVNIS